MTMLVFLITIVVAIFINNNTASYNINGLSSKTTEIDAIKASPFADVDHDRSHNKRMSRQLSGMNEPNDNGYLNIYVRQACRDDRRYPLKKMRFPYALFDRQRFRFSRSWVRFSRSMPIYADKLSRQTIIYSRTGVYILPPLVNYYGKLFSVAELLAYGYATLLQNVVPMSSHFNIRDYTRSDFVRGLPRFNPRTGRFNDAIRSNYRSYFKSECRHESYKKTGDEHPLPYDEDSYNSPEEIKEEYKQPRRRPRPHYAGPPNHPLPPITTKTGTTAGPSNDAAAPLTTTVALTTTTAAASTTSSTTESLTTGGTSTSTQITATLGSTSSTFSTATSSGTTTTRCEEMQAVDGSVSRTITVTPGELPKGENIEFQPTSTRGVSFPNAERTPTITVNFAKPAEIQSVTIPRDKTPNANVQQFEVTFYSPDGKKINDRPVLTNFSPMDDKTNPAHLDSTQIPSNTPVSRLEITIVHTTDDESPKGVILDIKVCTESTTD